MAFATTDDGINLFYEEAGAGIPVLFLHEFADDHRGWQPQLRHFARRYRCIAYNARGYPPSDVPEDPEARSFEAQGARATAERYTLGPARVQFLNKDPLGWQAFAERLAEHSPTDLFNRLVGGLTGMART